MTTTYIIQREDDVHGRSPEILVAKNVLPKLSRDCGDIFQWKAGYDISATLLDYLFSLNATKISELRS